MAELVKGKVSKRRGRPHPKQLLQPGFPFTAKLPDGRTLLVEVPGRWTTTDRSGQTALLPAGVRFIDRLCALATGLGNAKRPPSPGFITALREGLGLTQAELGERLGVDKLSVSRWERGAVRPSAESLAALEAVRREAVRKGVVIGG